MGRLIGRIIVLVVAALIASGALVAIQGAFVERFEAGGVARHIGALNLSRAPVVLPALSPFVGVAAAVSRRAAGWLLLFCAPLILVSLIRFRWFCGRLCPVGLICEAAARLRPQASRRFRRLPKIGPWIVLLAMGGALLGYPILLWMDPLAIFNGFFGAWHKPLSIVSAAPAVGLILIIVLSLVFPHAWCYRICPLGAFQELLGALRWRPRRRGAGSKNPVALGGIVTRRGALAALAGVIGGLLLSRRARGATVIRPPGSVQEDSFSGVCVRCGNCMRVCPERIIKPDYGVSGIQGLLTPVIRIGPGYCSEECNECGKVCPSGAIEKLTLEEKNSIVIGAAVVTRGRCIAWSLSQRCRICVSYCPFDAIKTVRQNGVPCPVVDPDICRGCGLCQTVCPAEQTAIAVTPAVQRRLQNGSLPQKGAGRR